MTGEELQVNGQQSTGGFEARSEPVRRQERIEVVDILRGFAIFGILLVNMYGFAGMDLNTQNYSGLDRVVVILILLLAQAKFYSLFSFLFGWGMWIQMSRAMAKGINFVPTYVRRMLVLLLIGILHGIFIWTGDILTVYAILGLLLLLFRKSSERTLLIAISLFLLWPIIVNMPGQAMDGFRDAYAEITSTLRNFGPQSDAVYLNGTYWQITERRFQEFVGGQTWFIYWIGNVFSMFLLGFYAGKRGYFRDINGNLPIFRRTMWIGLTVGLLLNGISVLVATRPDLVAPEWQRFVRISTRTIGAPALMLFYVSAITLLSQRVKWRNRLAHLAPVGRMALTNYLLQSVVVSLIFYGYGFGLSGEIGPTVGLILTVLVFLGNIRFSAWWMERYRFGPMEWLWRTLTYGRRQQIRKGKSNEDLRPIPGISRIQRLLSKRHPLTFLVVVWIGLVIWAVALISWNGRLTSEVYENPFAIVTESDPSSATGTSADDLEGEPEITEVNPEAEAIMPEMSPVIYDPGSVASSGDMQALAATFDASQALEQIEVLAGTEFAGRKAGSPGGRAAGDYIAGRMADYGLQPAGENGTFFQPFPVTYTLLTEVPELSITSPDGIVEDNYVLFQDFSPYISGYAGGGDGKGDVYWVNRCEADDFAGIDVEDKIVFCHSPSGGEDLTARTRLALEYGASGLLYLADPASRPADFGTRNMEIWVPESLPTLFVYPDLAADLFEGAGIVPDLVAEDLEPFMLETQMTIGVDTSQTKVVEARNVLGVIPGRDPEHRNEVVIIGAHYDHMGQGPDGTYWPGANDNASGVASVLEIARSWQEQGYVPRRTVIFAAWDAEEWGLIGSTTYVFRPSFPLEDTIATIQMDMVGSGSETLNIGGNTTLSNQLLAVADSLDIEARVTDLGRSDHVPFNIAGVPSSLLIWLTEGEVIYHYHRPVDLPSAIDPQRIAEAGTVAEIALLDLVESEPAIESLLTGRALAATENDLTSFLATSRPDQLATDRIWLEDLGSFEPASVDMTISNLTISGDKADGNVRIRVLYPDPVNNETTLVAMADMPVQFTRQESQWRWAGPSLQMAGQTDEDGQPVVRPSFAVAYPNEVDADLSQVGAEAARQYNEVAILLGLPVPEDSRLLLMPDAESLRVSTALSLPNDRVSWIGPGIVKLAYRTNISQSLDFSDAIVQLLLADAGITEEAAPWLWRGLPVVIQAERELVRTQSRHLPTLQRVLSGEITQFGSTGSWAAVDFLREQVGWDGLGRFIIALAAECRQGNCDDAAGQDSALQGIIRMDSEAFNQAWSDHWQSRLEAVQRGLDGLMQSRSQAVLAGDEQAFMGTVYDDDSTLAVSEKQWFSALSTRPVDSFSLTAQPAVLMGNGDVLADVTMGYRLAGENDKSINLTTLIKRDGRDYLWAGPSLETVSGSLVTIDYPDGQESLAQTLLDEADIYYRGLAEQLGADEPDPVTIELYENFESLRANVGLSFPDADWIRGWSTPGTAIRLRMLPVSNPADYRSVIVTQLARKLLYQKGVEAEWLLKGVSTYIVRPLDGGVTQRVTTQSLRELVDAMNEDRLFDLGSIPSDAAGSEAMSELATVQAWDSVRFLVNTYGWDELLDLLDEHGSGRNLDLALRTVLGESTSSFTDKWTTSLRLGHPPSMAIENVAGIDGESAYEHIEYLTRPELAGRLAGTEGSNLAAEYVAGLFEEYGLIPAGDTNGGSYMQRFSITTTNWAVEPFLEIVGDPTPYTLRQDMLFSRATTESEEMVSCPLVWIGTSPPENTDLTGQIMVAINTGDPDLQAEMADSFGAKGLILLGIKDEIPELHFKAPLNVESTADIPVLELTKDGTLRILETWGHTYIELSELHDVLPLDLEARMGSSFEEPFPVPAMNVLGLLPGSDPALSHEVVILGAHYDHVGDDPPIKDCPTQASDGSDLTEDCEPIPGQRYSGANDNGSGVGVLLEIARLWQENGYRPQRSILFAAWGAQEFGELGSGFYVTTPTLPLTDTIAMIQLDGLGGGGGFSAGMNGDPLRDAVLLFQARSAATLLDEKITETNSLSKSDDLVFSQAGIPALLFSWRLADENNLPDEYASGVDRAKLEVMGRLAALTVMMLAQ